ncbi:MAG: hypothetical protein ABEK42_06310 [Thiohalorhabdaceae bacterium]
MPPSHTMHGFRLRLRRAVLALLVGLVLGQPALLVHAMDHALEDGSPVCELCTVTQSAADTTVVPAMGQVDPAPHIIPFVAADPPAPEVLATAARDPPQALR